MATSMWRVRYPSDGPGGGTVTFDAPSEEWARAQAVLHSLRFGEAAVMISDGRWDDTVINYRDGREVTAA